MANLLQLDPPLPVIVTSKENKSGLAYVMIYNGTEHHTHWLVALNEGGEPWEVPNPEIRFQWNWTMGRRPMKES